MQSVALGTGPDRFVLTLPDEAIKRCHTVTVDYTVPATNPIQDTDGNEAAAFPDDFPVANNSTVVCPSPNPPVFPAPDDHGMFSVDENTPVGTAIGGAVTATDADGDTLTYSLLRTVDVPYATHFDIDAATGQLRNRRAFDYEAGGVTRANMMGIIVVADDGTGRTAQITVVVNVEDVDEPPDAPVEVAVTGSGTTSLLVTWATPPNEGRPDIESYDVQYREVGASSWTDGPQDVTGTEAIIRPVDAGKSYDVQVRATNDEGDGRLGALGRGRGRAGHHRGAVRQHRRGAGGPRLHPDAAGRHDGRAGRDGDHRPGPDLAGRFGPRARGDLRGRQGHRAADDRGDEVLVCPLQRGRPHRHGVGRRHPGR